MLLQAKHRWDGLPGKKVYYILTTCFNGSTHPAVTLADVNSMQGEIMCIYAGKYHVTKFLHVIICVLISFLEISELANRPHN